MFGWHVPKPDEAMLISGGKGSNGLPFKIVTGHGAFVLPFRSRVSYLTLSMQEAEVAEECVTKQGIAVKVGADFEGIASAAQRFLDDEGKMSVLTGRVFAGHLRSIIGSMTVEEIIRERQRLAEEALDASKIEMSRIGLVVDALQIESIDDMGSGYIQSLAAPHVATVRQNARIAQAQADQASAEAEQTSLRNQAEYERQTAIARAGYKAETDRAQSTAGQAGPLAQAQAQQEVLQAQTSLAQRNADLRQQQLIAEVIRPAEADAQRVKIAAAAEGEKIRALAEAAAANNRVSLDQQMIAQLPEMLRAAAEGLQGANLTVLNGSDGMGELISGLASQGLALYDTLRSSMGSRETTGPAAITGGTAVSKPPPSPPS
jgi:flotillin